VINEGLFPKFVVPLSFFFRSQGAANRAFEGGRAEELRAVNGNVSRDIGDIGHDDWQNRKRVVQITVRVSGSGRGEGNSSCPA